MIRGTDYNVFGLVGDTTVIDEKQVRANPYVANVPVSYTHLDVYKRQGLR